MQVDDLIERLKGATEGSRELDAAVAVALSSDPKARECSPDDERRKDGRFWCTGFPDEMSGLAWAKPYTTDLNAALALVEGELPSGWMYQARGNLKGKFHHFLIEDDDGNEYLGRNCPTLPLAVCIALLAALKEQNNG